MRTVISLEMERFRPFVERLIERFDREGEVLHAGRNTIRAFRVGSDTVVVKRYRRLTAIRTVIYSFFRKCKARRAYEHAVRLRALGFDTPTPIAWIEQRRGGLLRDSYLVTLRTDYVPLTEATDRFAPTAPAPVLDAFVTYVVRLHEAGILHDDFNHSNILWKRDPESGVCRFQLIDINRMRFSTRPLGRRHCMVNLRRLSCPTVPFLYILNRYAEARGWNPNDTLLEGVFFRLRFLRLRGLRKQLRRQWRAYRKGRK